MRRTPVEDYLEEISTTLPEETYGYLSDAIYETNCDFDEEVASHRAENAKLRDSLKALMIGTYSELCADRDAPQCRECSMRRDNVECAMTDAMELLGIDMYGEPMEVDE